MVAGNGSGGAREFAEALVKVLRSAEGKGQ